MHELHSAAAASALTHTHVLLNGEKIASLNITHRQTLWRAARIIALWRGFCEFCFFEPQQNPELWYFFTWLLFDGVFLFECLYWLKSCAFFLCHERIAYLGQKQFTPVIGWRFLSSRLAITKSVDKKECGTKQAVNMQMGNRWRHTRLTGAGRENFTLYWHIVAEQRLFASGNFFTSPRSGCNNNLVIGCAREWLFSLRCLQRDRFAGRRKIRINYAL